MWVISRVNGVLWGGPLLVLLLGIHIYFTIRTKGVQRKLGKALRYSLEGDSEGGMSAFGTLTTTLAATLGTGNIIGVSIAVFLGGPGGVFWCWITGILGMATTYAETYLCSLYRQKSEHGGNVGGMMYVLERGLKKRYMAQVYSFFICLSALFSGCTTQSNAISETCLEVWGMPKWFVGIVVALPVGLVILQGVKWIEQVCMTLVPAMAFLFLGGCVAYIIFNASYLPEAAFLIVKSAFTSSAFVGGTIGFAAGKAVRYGVSRGLFTNEAGLGTSGIAAASGSEHITPEKQGLISMTATFWDTVVMCAITGIVAVMFVIQNETALLQQSPGMLVKSAFNTLPLWGEEMIAIATICFAIATLIGWSYFGQVAAEYMGGSKLVKSYQYVYVCMIFIGAVMPMGVVWELTDFINIFILIPGIYALVKCRKQLFSGKNHTSFYRHDKRKNNC
nr:sodium:alanine symporter family protein [Eubacterium sp.]